MLYGNSDKIDAAVRMLSKFEIIETVRAPARSSWREDTAET